MFKPAAWMLMAMVMGVALLLPAPAVAQTPPASGPAPSAPCMERSPEGYAVAPAKLPSLRYSCLTLRNRQRVFVGEAGLKTARTVLLVHGLGNNVHRDWIYTVPALAQQFHVVAIDLPGFGASQAGAQGYSFEALGKAISEVLEQTAPGQRVHVVGHSLGGAVSLYFAHAHAAQVDRLVLVDAAGILLKPVFARFIAGTVSRQMGIPPIDRILKGFDERINSIGRSLLLGMDERFDFSRWLAQNPQVRYALLGRYVQVEAALGLVEHDFSAAIRETSAPTTVIWGRDDPIAPVRTGYLLAARMNDARLHVIEKAGHTPMHDKREAFNRLLQDALVGPLLPPRLPNSVAFLPPAEPSRGDVNCQNEADSRFTGSFDTLTLDNCTGAQIKNARIKQLVLKTSTVSIDDSVIESSDVALSAVNSEVSATVVQVRGRVAIRTERSQLDLAGVSLRASEKAVEMTQPGRIYFSVSDWQAPDQNGDAHFIWPPVLSSSTPK